MEDQKRKFINYLNANISRFITESIHQGIKAVLQGNFSNLPQNPSDEDWQILALMIDGYSLSKQLGLGELGEFLTKQCLPQYLETGLCSAGVLLDSFKG